MNNKLNKECVSIDVTDSFKLRIVGDLHLYDDNVGSHIDYKHNCILLMQQLIDGIIEDKVTHLIITGDISGAMSGRRFKTLKFRLEIHQMFKELNTLLKGNVYCLKGNHDFATADISEYDYMLGMGLIKHCDKLEINGKGIHLVDYGKILDPIEIEKYGEDILIMHDDIGVENEVMWYYAGNNTKMESLIHLEGINTMIGGHIHNPSPKILTTKVGRLDVDLFYVGSPTRPSLNLASIWEAVYVCDITDEVDSFSMDVHLWKLPALKDTFFVIEKIGLDGKVEYYDKVASSEIKCIIDNLEEYNSIYKQPIEKQIMNFPGDAYTEEVKQAALAYYTQALNK